MSSRANWNGEVSSHERDPSLFRWSSSILPRADTAWAAATSLPLKMVRKLGYHGLVELENLWSSSELEIERRGIDWLRRVDMMLT